MRSLVILAALLLAACGSHDSQTALPTPVATTAPISVATTTSPPPPSPTTPSAPTTTAPAASSSPPAAIAATYTIAIVGSSTVAGPINGPLMPLSVRVTDSSGASVDGVNVYFRSSGSSPSWAGPWGLGTDLSGSGTWVSSPPGSGIATVGCVPAVTTPVQVEASVVPVVSSAPTPPASSNTVFFLVVGQ